MTPIKKEVNHEAISENQKKYSVSAVQTDISAILMKQFESNMQPGLNPISDHIPKKSPKTEEKNK